MLDDESHADASKWLRATDKLLRQIHDLKRRRAGGELLDASQVSGCAHKHA